VGHDRTGNLPCYGQRLTAKSTVNGADRWVGSDEDERWPMELVRRMLLGGSRRGRWPILARAPGQDGLNSEKDNPQEPRQGGRRANPPAPGRWAPGGHQRPEELPRPSRVSLERVSSYDPKAAEPHRRNGGWRHPPPSGSPSGPVGPSGRSSNPDFPVQPRRPLGATFNSRTPRGGRQGDVSAGQTDMCSSGRVELPPWNFR
jgi:hypothetical protein